MFATQHLQDLGQSLWLDNITRGLLTSGTLQRYIKELAVTGLTSNPTIFDQAIRNTDFYDDAIRQKTLAGKFGEGLFFELALEDLTTAADLFRPVHDATGGVDGWVSLEVSPLLAADTAGTIRAAAQLHARAKRSNLYIKIPGTREGLAAIEETIFSAMLKIMGHNATVPGAILAADVPAALNRLTAAVYAEKISAPLEK